MVLNVGIFFPPFSNAAALMIFIFCIGTDRLERSVSQENVQKEEQWHVEKSSLKVYSSSDLEGSGTRNHVPFFSALPSSLILRSAFRHLKMMSPNTPMLTENGCKKHESDNTCEDEMQQKDLTASLLLDRESSSYSCDSKIDPLWPLCMYELRGKCNNDECPWQHLNNCSGGNRHRCHISDNAGMISYYNFGNRFFVAQIPEILCL